MRTLATVCTALLFPVAAAQAAPAFHARCSRTFFSRTRPDSATFLLVVAAGRAEGNGAAPGAMAVRVLARLRGAAPARPVDSTAVVVPWSRGARCEPVPWLSATPALADGDTAVIEVDERPPGDGGAATVTYDLYVPDYAYPSGRSIAVALRGAGPGQVLGPAEHWELVRVLPTAGELRQRGGAAFDRLEAWAAARPGLAARDPARDLLCPVRNLRLCPRPARP